MTETLSRNWPEGDREGTGAGYKKKLIQKDFDMAGNFKKTINKTAVVLPYSIWSGLKNCPRDIIIDTIDLMIAYDYRWLANEEAGLPQTIPKPDTGRKLNPTAITLFTFARDLIDANNRRYYSKQLEKIERDKKAAETGAANPEEAIEDHLPAGM